MMPAHYGTRSVGVAQLMQNLAADELGKNNPINRRKPGGDQGNLGTRLKEK